MDIVVLGLAIGMGSALLAVGLVLIYKANRVINLAHGELGAFTVAMMLALTINADWNYWAALATSLAATALLSAWVERIILRRLFRSPRVILLIATIGVAQLIIVLRLVIPKPKLASSELAGLFGGAGDFPVPFHFDPIPFGNIVLHPGHILALIVGPLLALAVFAFLRWSPYGIALRAAAENAPRARLLGIPVRRVSTVAWVVAGLLSGVASVLLAPIIGFSSTEAVGLPILMRGLAAATIARMESVGIAFAVGLGLGVADQVVFYSTGRSGLHGPDPVRRRRRRPLVARRRAKGRAGVGGVLLGVGGAGAAAPDRDRRAPAVARRREGGEARRGGDGGRPPVRARTLLHVPAGDRSLVAAVAVSLTVLTAGRARCRSASGRSPAWAGCSARSWWWRWACRSGSPSSGRGRRAAWSRCSWAFPPCGWRGRRWRS